MYIEIPQVAKCCCKLSLKFGSLIVGLNNEVVGTLVVCAAIYNIDSDQDTRLTSNLALFTHYTGLVFSLLFGVGLVTSASLLLIALFKERYSFILPFFLVQSLLVLLNLSGLFLFLIRTFSNVFPNALYVLFFFLYGGSSFYFFIVVYSFYREATWNSTIS